MDRPNTVLLTLAVVAGIAVSVTALAVMSGAVPAGQSPAPDQDSYPDTSLLTGADEAGLEQFAGEDEFTEYVQRGQRIDGYVGRLRVFEATVTLSAEPTADANCDVAVDEPRAAEGDTVTRGGGGGDGPDRVSGTNVQVRGLDEPDILKTDGQHIYYAPHYRDHRGASRQLGGHGTQVISAAEPGRPEVIAEIESNGRLLRSGDSLVVIEDDRLVGYDVSTAQNPEKRWTQPLNNSVVTARLYDGALYLVTQERVSVGDPCPIEPLGGDETIRCSDVYHPETTTPVDSTYTALVVDPGSGSVEDAESFVGTSDSTAVYMSPNALYVTYTQPADRGQLRLEFLLNEQRDRLPGWVVDRLETIEGYDISSRSKLTEADRTLEQWYRSMGETEREVTRENVRNAYRRYLRDHQRELVRTGIVQVGIENRELSVENVEQVPGRPLNQFSLDEHDGSLRITTTVPEAGGAESRNDLYVLDADDLGRQGSVTDMGVNERVYSVRYAGDTAYVVTFRRIDPFHVIDLSDPTDPTEVGELELPGFSTYLHPVDDDRVLGIGKEDGRVKAVLFDVSDPSEPTVQDDFILDSRWSAIDDSHHAFLLDRQHGVFFLPTGEGGNVIDYTGGELELETRVDTGSGALRAMYVDDYMYVFGDETLTVVDETTWEQTDRIELG